MADRWDDLGEKVGRLVAVARRAGVDQLVLREPAMLGWLLGIRVHVPQTLDTACLDVIVDVGNEALTLVANAIEAPRLRETELDGADVAWRIVPWWQPRESVLPEGPGVGSDRPSGGWTDLREPLADVRRVLTPAQQSLLAEVCRDAAAAATQTASDISPEQTEYAAAGLLASALLERELDPIVLMVGELSRGARHRHPLPTGGRIGHRAMLVCCARRHGLVASVTRIVAFGSLSAAEADGYRRLLEVERAFLDASRPGVPIGDAFARGIAAYPANGFDASEWHRHHQGGFSGLQPREFPAHQDSGTVIPAGSVLAWNPSAAGWKVEDTAVVGSDGPQLLVHDAAWPTADVGGRARPQILVR